MRRSSSPLFILPLFLVLLLFLLPCSEAKKKTEKKSKPDAVAGEDAPQPPGRAILGSGEMTTKEGHRCSWEAREGRNNILLQMSCSVSSEEEGLAQTYSCQFSGKPQECAAYVGKPSQYWKQVMSKLKKRANVCEGEKVLKTRLCKKGPAAAHMKLAERKGEEAADGAKETSRKKTAAPSGRKEGEKEKGKEEKEDELMQGDSDGGFGEVSDEAAEEAQSYCGEGWHSVCRFFVKLLDG